MYQMHGNLHAISILDSQCNIIYHDLNQVTSTEKPSDVKQPLQ